MNVKRLAGRIIPFEVLWQLSVVRRQYRLLKHGMNAPIYENEKFGEVLNEYANRFLAKEQLVDRVYMANLEKDVKKSFVLLGFTPRDYFLFDFHDKNKDWKSRKSFVSDVYKDYRLYSKEGPEKYKDLFDKWLFFKKAGSHFKRAAMFLDENTTENEFVNFATSVKNLFIKPYNDSYGRGAKAVKIQLPKEAKELYVSLLMGGKWMIEELLCQRSEMGKWNESSVNTVRLNSYLTDKGFFVLAPFMRSGRKGSIVDNGGAGGIYASIDAKTGEIYTDAFDEKGNRYVVHPDSKEPYKGVFIPEWQELLKEAERIHRECMPDHIYIGWDFAYTQNGWTVIEGNWGQFICQQSSAKSGFKKKFDEYMSYNPFKN